MTEIYTTYTVTGENSNIVWQFKYRLNGLLFQFKLLEGELDEKQIKWLFVKANFPYNESQIKGWKTIKEFKIEIGKPDLSFNAFWETYNQKVKKVMSEKAWKRLSQKDQMAAIAYVKTYDKYLSRKHVAKAAPSTYINQRYWEDNHGSIH